MHVNKTIETSLAQSLFSHPTIPSAILELENLSHDVFELDEIRQSPDHETLKL